MHCPCREKVAYKSMGLHEDVSFIYKEGDGKSFAKALEDSLNDFMVQKKTRGMNRLKRQLIKETNRNVATWIASP